MRSVLIRIAATLALVVPHLAWAAARVEMKPVKDPPDMGDNRFQISVLDEAGKPFAGATVKFMASMPAMGTMPYMEIPGDVEKKGEGNFVGEVELTMGGTWDLTVTVESKGTPAVFRYAVTTGVPGVTNKNDTTAAPGDSHQHGATPSSPTGSPSALRLSPDRLQRIGVRFTEVKRESLSRTIRASGLVESDSSRRAEVLLRYPGYAKKLFGRQVGDLVKAGDPLVVVESPELVAAQREYILALQMQADAHIQAPVTAERLRTLGMSEADIATLAKSRKPVEAITVRAPQQGSILEMAVREGARIEPGQVLFVIGDLQKTYIVARVFQQDLPDLKVGQKVDVHVPGGGDRSAPGVVDLIYPTVAEGSGTANVRIRTLAPLPMLRAGNYAQIQAKVSWPATLVVPNEAVLFSGQHSYVFVDKGGGALEPVEIVRGRQTETHTEVAEGLSEGERIAASGTFLLSSEANLRSALPKWKTGVEK